MVEIGIVIAQRWRSDLGLLHLKLGFGLSVVGLLLLLLLLLLVPFQNKECEAGEIRGRRFF